MRLSEADDFGESSNHHFSLLIPKSDVNATPKRSLQTPLHLATDQLKLDAIRLLLDVGNADPTVRDINGKTARELCVGHRKVGEGILAEAEKKWQKRTSVPDDSL